MQLQIGKKRIEEIESLIDRNCWKALTWIHSVLLRQLQYIFFYGKLPAHEFEEHKDKKKMVMREFLRYFSPAMHLCYIRNLISKEEFDNLTAFNKFRNGKIGHPDIQGYLPDDKEVKEMSRKGINLIKSLDKKFTNYVSEREKGDIHNE